MFDSTKNTDMKKFNKIFLATIVLLLFSCDNEGTPAPNGGLGNEETLKLLEASSVYEHQIDDNIERYLFQILMFGRGSLSSGINAKNFQDCSEYTLTETENGFDITLNFDAEGCEDDFGNLHQGQVQANVVLGMDTIYIVKYFETYSFNDVAVIGMISSQMYHNDEGQRVTHRVSDINLTNPEGISNDRTASHTATRIAGAETEDYSDDVYSILGNSTNILSTGTTWVVNNLGAVVRPGTCSFYAVAGQKNIVNYENNISFYIDYGDGACDGVFDLTMPSGDIIQVFQF